MKSERSIPPVEHFFRHEYGKLVATLCRQAGLQHLEAIEDAAQSALLKAVEGWKCGAPDNPTAWLFRVARNALVDELRRAGTRERAAERLSHELASRADDVPDEAPLAGELNDDLLRMLFVCCDDRVPTESQLVLALKVLCGFDVGEIAQRLFISEANVYKRLGRARERLRESPNLSGALSPQDMTTRRSAVHTTLYLLFTEGYLSANADSAIRRELCHEAVRLGTLLARHRTGNTPESAALLALMHLHLARLPARLDPDGGLLLLEEQDRSLWDRDWIETGMVWLARSAEGEHFSRYHAEAGIAAEHCRAPSYDKTRWDRIAGTYALLETAAPSALHRLNRAVAVAEWQGPEAGLSVIAGFEPPTWLAGSYMWSAVLADLHRRCGHEQLAADYRRAALATAPTPAIRALLERRLGS